MKRVTIVLVALLLALGAVAAGNWAELFDKGKEAVEQGSFSQGRDLLLEARQAKADEGRVRIGMKSWEYYPSHYLAKAYIGLGELDDAERFLKAAEAVKDQSAGEKALLGELRRQFEQARRAGSQAAPVTPAETRPVPPSKPAVSPNAELARKAFTDGDVGTARRLAEAALAENPGDADAKAVLDNARGYTKAKVGAARDNLAAEDFDTAESAIKDAIRSDPTNVEALALRDEIKSRKSASAASAAPPLVKPPKEPASQAIVIPPRPASGTSPAGASGGVVPPPPSRPDPASASPGARDARLVAAYEQFFRGEVQAAIAALEAATADGKDAEALAVLGAAHATQGFLAADASDTREMDAAKDLFEKALERDSRLRLDSRWFSPRIRDVFDQVRSRR